MKCWKIACCLFSGACGVVLAQTTAPAVPAAGYADADVDTSRPMIASVNPVGNGDFVGATYTGSDFVRYDEIIFQRASEIGSRSARVLASWREIEAEPGRWDFSSLDREMHLCAKYGIEPVVLIVNIPAWVSPIARETHKHPPNEENAEDFHNFITRLAERYKGRARYYEFWNEPNGFGWHVERRPDGTPWYNRADEYVPWLRRCYKAIKAVDPDAQVAIGGLDDVQGNAPIFVEMAYKMRRDQYNNEQFWDAIADHPYNEGESADPEAVIRKLDAIRAVAARYGDRGVKLWITEYGWNTTEVPEEIQKNGTRDFLQRLVQPDQKDVIIAQQLALADFDQAHTGFGLCDLNLRPRPACLEFQRFARRDVPTVMAPPTYRLPADRALQVEGQLVPTMTAGEPPTYVEVFDEQGRSLASSQVTNYQLAVTFRDLPADVPLIAAVSSDHQGRRQAPIWRTPVMVAGGLVVNGGFESYFRAGVPWGWTTRGQAIVRDGGTAGPQYRHAGDHALMLMLFKNAPVPAFDDQVESPVPAEQGQKFNMRCMARFFGPPESDPVILLSAALVNQADRLAERAPGIVVGREWTAISATVEAPLAAPVLRLHAVSETLPKGLWLLCIDDVELQRLP